MRRNTVTILKYVVVAAIFCVLGPLTLRALFGAKDGSDVMRMNQGGRGLPEAPFDPTRDTLRTHRIKEFKFTTRPPKVIGDPHGDPFLHAVADGDGKIDWHDYDKMVAEQQRTGPGEQGAAVLLSAEEEQKKNALYKVNGFNAYASDKISLDRSLRDIRHPMCKHKKYLAKLLTASIIVPFHNEHWTTLLRLVHSILNRSPPSLVHEIILVDDFSTKDFLKKPLDDHVATNYNGKVKVVHAKKREGLIRTRLLGARAATGDVLIFLDSHCEANTNWLPPLLEPIAKDSKTVVCPFIDVIDFETFAYRAQDEGARGAFDWEFFYKRLPLLKTDLQHPAEPFKSPVMAGGLFAIHRQWFWDMGGYDPGLDIWGGEQYELSFKLWQCGGMMVDAPCSRVGHVYRKFAPFPNPGIGDFVGRNYRRVAEVWMDEYKEFLYKRRPHYRNIETGDLSEQFAIRKKLNCKPFKWFMKEVAFDLADHYPPVEPPSVAEGELRNMAANLCVDTRYKNQGERFQLETCITDKPGAGGEQNLELTWHKDVRPRKRNVCFDASSSVDKAPVILYNCHGMKGNQHFKFNPDTRQMYHPISGQCLDCDKERQDIFMSRCNPSLETQQWKWQTVNTTAARIEWGKAATRRLLLL